MKLLRLLQKFGPQVIVSLESRQKKATLRIIHFFPEVNSKALSLWVNFSSAADSPNRAKWMGLAATHLSIF